MFVCTSHVIDNTTNITSQVSYNNGRPNPVFGLAQMYSVSGKQYSFDENGRFVDVEGNDPPPDFDHRRKDLASWVHEVVQQKMVELGLEEFTIPDSEGAIYITKNAFNSPSKLLVLVCGSGRVMPGVWSVGLCVYRGLKVGSVLPMIAKAAERNMEIVVLNPNKGMFGIFEHSAHVRHVFEEHIIPATPEHVYVVAHSMGGEAISEVMRNFPEWTIERMRAVALTDGVEIGVTAQGMEMERWTHAHVVNWVCGVQKVNEEVGEGVVAVHRSAGTKDHAFSTFAAFEHVWSWLDEMGAAAEPEHVGVEDVEDYRGYEAVKLRMPRCTIA